MIASIADIPLRNAIGSLGPLLRDGATLVAIVVTVGVMRRQGADLSVPVLILLVMLAHSVIGVVTMGPTRIGFSQVSFGIKLLLPFFAGMCLWVTMLEGGRLITRIYYVCWGLACLGVVLDWLGLIESLKHTESTVDGVRGFGYQTSYAADVVRISGFSRNWGSAAANIALLALVLFAQTTSPVRRLLIVLLSLWPLWLTNTKSMILSFAITIAVKVIAGRYADSVYRFLVLILVFLVVLVPVVMSGELMHAPSMSSLSLWSFVDRMHDSWPRTFRIIDTVGLGVLGRGIGGVGSPQYVWDPTNYTAPDNLFMLAYGYFGIAAVAYLAVICVAAARAQKTRPSLSPALMILVCELCSGITATILESPFDGILCGAAVAALVAGGSSRRARSEPNAAIGQILASQTTAVAAPTAPSRLIAIRGGKSDED